MRVDPRTKLLALLLVNALVMGKGSFLLTLVAGAVTTTLLAAGAATGAIRWAHLGAWCLWSAAWASAYLAAPLMWVGWGPTLCAALGFWFTRFSVGAGLAYWVVATTRVGHLAAALERMRAPRHVVIPFAVMLRFAPVLVRELRAIADAMRLRGLASSPLSVLAHPVRMAEHVLVPMLASTTRMSDDLAASAMLRGLGQGVSRTSVAPLALGVGDLVVAALCAGLVVLRVTGWEVPS
ncbi:energy-coupling factor transporter transmembrane protein EcfT [Schaalia sp. 19OD2882]|uniref:energy-coupling factor transporter transmembrane component T n=1 Tax=Schaalia sp. 19OD2882 TaxID=2794089 RepID=UPI001C1EA601|nr:energy-coupling factor transporter transmembrane component T [Schaalia sp. 19OD2882]QWW19396.1 energy-coupling factor transporter transmembrane protein EcfT [Schaalia sp. 19OD2882]